MKASHGKFFIFVAGAVVVIALSTASAFANQTKARPSKAPTKPQTNSAPTVAKPKVDLNTASEKDLDELPGIGSASSKKIIAGRPYSSVSDLSKVGITAATIKKITPLVTVSAVPPKRPPATASTPAPKPTPAATAPAPTAAPPPAKSAPPAATPPPSTSAQTPPPPSGSGKVWVNTATGVYHYEGDRWYGKTKAGKYMSEGDAVKAGYRPEKKR